MTVRMFGKRWLAETLVPYNVGLARSAAHFCYKNMIKDGFFVLLDYVICLACMSEWVRCVLPMLPCYINTIIVNK